MTTPERRRPTIGVVEVALTPRRRTMLVAGWLLAVLAGALSAYAI